MPKRTPIDKLDKAIQKILDDYGDDIKNGAQNAAKEVTKKGVTAVRANAKSNFKISKAKEKNYGKGWTSQFETGRLSYQGVIYNKDLPGLPHLLEHGHAKRGGGRVDGRVHIKPVEDEIVKKFEKEVKQAIDRAGA